MGDVDQIPIKENEELEQFVKHDGEAICPENAPSTPLAESSKDEGIASKHVLNTEETAVEMNDAKDSILINCIDGPKDSCDSTVSTLCDLDSSVSEAEKVESLDASDNTYSSIMSVCSSAAQQIKQTISEVLNSRKEDTVASSKSDDLPNMLEASLKEKIADFENSVKNNFSTLEQNSKAGDDASSQILTYNMSPETVEHKNSKMSDTDTILMEIEGKNSPVNLVAANENSENRDQPDAANCTESAQNKHYAAVHQEFSAMLDSISINEKYLKKSLKNSSNKKKGEKTVDQILKSLSNLSTNEEKLQVLCRKHTETLEELRSNEGRLKLSDRQVLQLGREKEQLQAEHNRMILAKSRLESLCRELQRQNKAVKEESLLRIREEEEKRKDVASKFQTTLNEISTLMQDNSKKNLQLKEENGELAQKLKSLVEHYEMWEKHMEKVVQQKDLEAQLAKAKHAKINLQLKQETEKFLKEKQSLLENMSELQKKCTQLASNELQLRTELGDYTTKYEEFQTVLNKSSQVFATFKTDMETTSKKIKKLEKETNVWKQKWESSNSALLEMITDKQKRDKEIVNAQQRILMLEKLCRALQAERNDLQNQVKGLSPPDCTQACNEVQLPGESASSETVAAIP